MPTGKREADPASLAGHVPKGARNCRGGRSTGAAAAGGCAFAPSAANRSTCGRALPQRRGWL
eukprot:15680485-Heterocapsa_arctica.AAC.1